MGLDIAMELRHLVLEYETREIGNASFVHTSFLNLETVTLLLNYQRCAQALDGFYIYINASWLSIGLSSRVRDQFEQFRVQLNGMTSKTKEKCHGLVLYH